MIHMTLWRILFKAQAQSDAELTCDECFAILNYLVDQQAIGDSSLESVWRAVNQHLARCPDCREHYSHWLRQLEDKRTLERSDKEC